MSTLSESTASRLEAELRQLYETTIPNNAVLFQRSDLLQRIQHVISRRYGAQFRVEGFGSTSYGVSGAGSDLDLAIVDQDRPDGFAPNVDMENLPPIYNPGNLARTLVTSGYQEVVPIRAAVPIVKFIDPKWKIQCDINTNEQFGIRNSRLIKAYLDLTSYGRLLVLAVKHWAKHRGLNDPAGTDGPITLSSYTLSLLLLAYLQSIGHLPNLQSLDLILRTQTATSQLWARPKTKRLFKRGKKNARREEKPVDHSLPVSRVCCDTTFVPRPPEDAWPHNDPGVVSALIGFFGFYASGFVYEAEVVSLAEGGIISRIEGFQEPPPLPTKERKKKKDNGANESQEVKTGDSQTQSKTGTDHGKQNAEPLATKKPREGQASSKTNVESLPIPPHGTRQAAREDVTESSGIVEPSQLSGSNGKTSSPPPADVNDHEDGRPHEQLPTDLPDIAYDELDEEDEDNQAEGNDEHGGDQQPNEWKEQLLIVQDPFIRARNTSQNIRPSTVRHIQKEFARARDILIAEGTFEEVCAKLVGSINGEAPLRKKGKSMKPKASRPVPAPVGADGIFSRDPQLERVDRMRFPEQGAQPATQERIDRPQIQTMRVSAREAARQSLPPFDLDALLGGPGNIRANPSTDVQDRRNDRPSGSGRQIHEVPARKREQIKSNTVLPDSGRPPHKLYVEAQAVTDPRCILTRVPEEVSESGLFVQLSNKFGKVKTCTMYREEGRALVVFEELDAAKRAIVASLPGYAYGEGPGVLLSADQGFLVRVSIWSASNPQLQTTDHRPRGNKRNFHGRGLPRANDPQDS